MLLAILLAVKYKGVTFVIPFVLFPRLTPRGLRVMSPTSGARLAREYWFTSPPLIQIFPSDFCFAILHFRLKSHGVYAIINTTPHKMGDAVWIDLIFSRMLRG